MVFAALLGCVIRLHHDPPSGEWPLMVRMNRVDARLMPIGIPGASTNGEASLGDMACAQAVSRQELQFTRKGLAGIWMADHVGGKWVISERQIPISWRKVEGAMFCFNADGTSVVGGGDLIQVFEPAGHVVQIGFPPGTGIEDLALSPDSRWLAYSEPGKERFHPGDDPILDLHLANLKTKKSRVVGVGSMTCWSPDGSRIAAIRRASGNDAGWNVYVYDVASGKRTKICEQLSMASYTGLAAVGDSLWVYDREANDGRSPRLLKYSWSGKLRHSYAMPARLRGKTVRLY